MVKINKLKAKIIENGLSIEQLCAKIPMNKSTFHRRMKNSTFIIKDVVIIAKELSLTSEEVNEIFFS
jgi:energy-converting hydrogenase A subunit M